MMSVLWPMQGSTEGKWKYFEESMFLESLSHLLNISLSLTKCRIIPAVCFFLGGRGVGVVSLIVYREFEHHTGMLNIIVGMSLLSRTVVYFLDKSRYSKAVI